MSFNPVCKVFHSPLACLSRVFGIWNWAISSNSASDTFSKRSSHFFSDKESSHLFCSGGAFSFSIAHVWMGMDTMIDSSNCFSLTFQTCLPYTYGHYCAWIIAKAWLQQEINSLSPSGLVLVHVNQILHAQGCNNIHIYLYPSGDILQRLYRRDTNVIYRTLCMYIPLMFDISTAVG